MNAVRTICSLSILCLVGQAALAAPTVAQLDTIVADFGRADLFSGTVMIAKDNKLLFAAVAGEANKDTRTANALETSYNIGSIGKTFTAVAILQLVEAGKLALSDPLGKHLPDYPFAEKTTITIAHLLNHSSGLGNYMAHPDFVAKQASLRRISDVLPLIYAEKPEFAAGERFGYSNSGMVVLGAIIERASGMGYEEYLRAHVFQPAGMRRSGIVQEDQVLPNRALGYSKIAAGGYRSNVNTIPPAFSDGGMRTTAGDLLKFDQALNSDKLLSAESKRRMFTPTGPDHHYGYGWESRGNETEHYVGHNGGAPGVNAEFRHYDAGYTMIVLSNYNHGATEVVNRIEAALFDRPYAAPTAADVNFALATDLQDQDQNAEALTVLDRNRDLKPLHVMSLYTSARLRILDRKEPQQAIDDLERYLQAAPADSEPSAAAAWWRKGNAYEQLNNPAEAIRCYEKAITLDPLMPQPHADLHRLKAT